MALADLCRCNSKETLIKKPTYRRRKSVGSVENQVSGATFLIYFSHFLSAWGDRMWQFAVSLFLIEIAPGSLQLTAIFGLSAGGATLFFGALIGDWVDKNPRLRVARTSLLLQNCSVILCAATVALLIAFQDVVFDSWDGWMLSMFHCLIIILAVCAQMGSLASTISVERDWIAKICSKDKDRLATMSSVLRRIDLITNIMAPIATGQVMTYASLTIGAIFIAFWNLCSVFLEYFMLWKVFVSIPELAFKDEDNGIGKECAHVSNDDYEPSAGCSVEGVIVDGKCIKIDIPHSAGVDKTDAIVIVNEGNVGQHEKCYLNHRQQASLNEDMQAQVQHPETAYAWALTSNLDEPVTVPNSFCNRVKELILTVLSSFVILYKGWRTYLRYNVSFAGLALACLYMTVLGFDNVTTAYAYSQGLSESILGVLMAVGAFIGIFGTFAYPKMRTVLGLERTGIYSFIAQLTCLSMCVVSVWLPGSPFFATSYWNSRNISTLSANCTNTQDGGHILQSAYPLSASAFNESFSTSDDFVLQDWHESTPASSLKSSYLPICLSFDNTSYTSIIMLMIGIVTARFGLWVTDLTVTQLQLEQVTERERGVVTGVQSSVNMLMEMMKYVMVVAAPRPEVFGILVHVSFLFICVGFILYLVFSFNKRDIPSKAAYGKMDEYA